jgi:hypothetical protein
VLQHEILGSTGSTDITFTGGISEAEVGDLMIMLCATEHGGGGGENGAPDEPTSGGAWTELFFDDSGSRTSIGAWYRVVEGSEPDPVALFTGTSGTPDNFAVLMVLKNAATPTFEDEFAWGGGNDNFNTGWSQPTDGTIEIFWMEFSDGGQTIGILGPEDGGFNNSLFDWNVEKEDSVTGFAAHGAACMAWTRNRPSGNTSISFDFDDDAQGGHYVRLNVAPA